MNRAFGRSREAARQDGPGPVRGDVPSHRWSAHIQHMLAYHAFVLAKLRCTPSNRRKIPWWQQRAIRRRNALLRQLAKLHFSELSVAEQARAICELAERYHARDWPFDSSREQMPPHYRDTPFALLFQACRLSAPMPVSRRHLRAILGAGRLRLWRMPW